MRTRDHSRGWLVAALCLSAAAILGAPFIGQLRAEVRSATGGSFPTFMAVAVGGAGGLAILYALARIRDRRQPRYTALAAAVAIAVGYAMAASTGNAEVDAVERFHFVEYGLITVLFYRAWRPAADGSVVLMPMLAGLLVGIMEEWLQWFIPARIGELHDVLLNFFAIVCGLLFSLGLDPPTRVTGQLTPRSRRRVSVLTAVTLVAFGGFFHSVHLGHEITDADAGVFRSRYPEEALARLGDDRARRWRTNPPLTWSRLSREDQYQSEGEVHVRRRNQAWQEGNVLASRHENLILEKYYPPVLDTPSYLSAQGHRWPDAQRADAESRVGPGFMIYVSDAFDYPIVIWPKWAFWGVIAALAGLALRGVRVRA